MPQKTYDCAVIGLGGFGSSTLFHLVKQGLDVIGIEQFNTVHDLGSSHGETRVIRQAYFEHPDYVPLLYRSYELFEELEEEADVSLFEKCGLVAAGHPEGQTIRGIRLAGDLYGVPIENVLLNEVSNRFPGFKIPENFEVVYEPNAGYLHVEECVRTHLHLAEKLGATIRVHSPVKTWKQRNCEFEIQLQKENIYAKKLIITAGAWTVDLLSDLGVPLQVRRKVLCWQPVNSDAYHLQNGGSTFFFELPEGDFYGFPSLDGQTVKLAEHSGGKDISHPDQLDRELAEQDGESVRTFVSKCMPELSTETLRKAVCMYTLTPDQHFLIDEHPLYDGLYLGAGFSGHGFKFTSVLGEALAQLASNGETTQPVDFLRLNRFNK